MRNYIFFRQYFLRRVTLFWETKRTSMSLIISLVSSWKTTQLPTGLVVSTALQSLSFPPVLNGEGTVKKAELVRLFYKQDWSDETRMYMRWRLHLITRSAPQ
jgi:hypothetical protein